MKQPSQVVVSIAAIMRYLLINNSLAKFTASSVDVGDAGNIFVILLVSKIASQIRSAQCALGFEIKILIIFISNCIIVSMAR